MDKKVIILACLAALLGIGLGILRSPQRKGEKAQNLFPPEKLQGYVKNTSIKIVEDGKNGRPITAIAIAHYGIKPEEVSPTGYGALQALHHQYPKTDWVSVFIAEDSAMAEVSNWVGVAELRNGNVTVTGGLPTDYELDSLSKMGQMIKRPTAADLAATSMLIDSTQGLAGERWELSQTLLGAGSGRIDKSHFFTLDLETATLHSIAKSLGQDPKTVQKTANDVVKYYWLKAGNPL